MRLNKLSALFTVFAGCSGLATAADAGTFTYYGYGFSGENVHISDTLVGVNNEYGGAGLISLNGPSTIAAYCVDIADWLQQSGTYNSAVNPASNPNLAGLSSYTGHSKIADIAALIYNGTNAAAVQLAIWETEYGASITITPDDSGLQAIATTYLSNVQSLWTLPSGLGLDELTPANGQINQSLVYLAAVPEPASVAILFSAVLGLGYLRTRHLVGQRAG